MSTVRAWHFVGATLRDGRPVPDAARDAFDALVYESFGTQQEPA